MGFYFTWADWAAVFCNFEGFRWFLWGTLELLLWIYGGLLQILHLLWIYIWNTGTAKKAMER